VAKDQTAQSASLTTSHVSSVHGTQQGKKSTYTKDSRGFDEKHLPHSIDNRLRPKEIERQIIEKELQRQRRLAISGHIPKTGSEVSTHLTHPHEIIRLKREVQEKTSFKRDTENSDLAEEMQQVPKKRRIIIQKKAVHSVTQDSPIHDEENNSFIGDDELSSVKRPAEYSQQIDSEELKVGIKRNSAYKSRDQIFEGKGVRKTATPQVKDSVLIHTDLKPKKNTGESKTVENSTDSGDSASESSNTSIKRERHSAKKDDINWI
jgi:hypothetical protein